MKKDPNDANTRISRRTFLGTGAAAGAASFLPGSDAALAQEQESRPVAASPSPEHIARDTGAATPPPLVERSIDLPASDLMVQVLRDLGIEYVAVNPGSSFEGLQESIVNYGDTPNVMPELISALHEESAVDMAHGYARAEGRPICALITGTVGLQHAAMAIYQAFCGQAPVIVMVGRDDEHFLQAQTADDIAGIVRPFTKWDAQPTSVEDTLEAMQEAYRQAMTPPRGPVVLVLDGKLQKQEAAGLEVPEFTPPGFDTVTEEQARTIASALLEAKNPRLAVGRLRTPSGVTSAIELAELIGASVESRAASGPMSFPQRHPLSGAGSDENYDYVLGLERPSPDVSITGPGIRTLDDRDIVGINFGVVRPSIRRRRGATGGDTIVADAEASLPPIIAAVRALSDDTARAAASDRSQRHGKANRAARRESLKQTLEEKRKGWNASPISLARLYAELRPLIKDLDWCLASPSIFSSRHHVELWDHDKPWSYLGSYPASAIGYCLGASTGAALAARDRDRIVINIQGDGDFNYTPGAMWTAAHHKLPLLTIMHNNRAWHMELMYLQYIAGLRGRATDRAHIGTTFRDPYIDYAKLAAGYGVESEGPISDPGELAAALRRGVDAVTSGRPYLIDVLTQPR